MREVAGSTHASLPRFLFCIDEKSLLNINVVCAATVDVGLRLTVMRSDGGSCWASNGTSCDCLAAKLILFASLSLFENVQKYRD